MVLGSVRGMIVGHQRDLRFAEVWVLPFQKFYKGAVSMQRFSWELYGPLNRTLVGQFLQGG